MTLFVSIRTHEREDPSVSISSQFRLRDDVVLCDNSEAVSEPMTRLGNVCAQGSCVEQQFLNFEEAPPVVMGGG